MRNNRSQRFLTHTTKVTRRIEKSFTNTLVGPSEEKDYIESTKVSSVVEYLIASSGSKLYSCFGLITSPLAFFLSLWILWAIFGRYSLFGIAIYLLLIPI